MIEAPVSRRLRVLAFDPSLATRLETATVNQLTLSISWEELAPGPVGEYVEVVDYDPASRVFYRPVDLDDPRLLAQDGIAPSESNPQFHQQMVYAVAMTTIRQFERALGRVAFWGDREFRPKRGQYRDQFVRRLRIYPHALRDRNAYYSPAKKALLFGYFPITAKDRDNTPGTLLFTALSHDIIAHEVTHALLDGVHPRFNEPSNPDVHAFHEAFADLVALFQHFSYPAVLESQVQRTRGSLHTENLLSQLAQQFGLATGRGTALRDALGGRDETGEWRPARPDPHAFDRVYGAHARGAVLVAAVFRAFLAIYRARSADLFRIATQGTGTLPEGDIHPDLTRRLAVEAAKCADRTLQMCIRAIDYCPPVDITFGDFLRGVVTADLDYAPEDEEGFRVAFIQSFREWGIHPRGVTSMGADALAWPSGDELTRNLVAAGASLKAPATGKRYIKESLLRPGKDHWNLESDRHQVWKALDDLRWKLWKWFQDGTHDSPHYAELFGLVIDDAKAPPTVYRKNGHPTIEVHSVRPAVRRTIHGSTRTDLVVEITQGRRGSFDRERQKEMDGAAARQREGRSDFIYRAGCTIVLDPATQAVRRVIRTPGTIADNDELERVRRFRCGEAGVSGNAFDAGLAEGHAVGGKPLRDEPFALLHRHQED